jgi:hypothetical protein
MADKSTTEKDDQLSQPPAADNTVAEQEITDLRSRPLPILRMFLSFGRGAPLHGSPKLSVARNLLLSKKNALNNHLEPATLRYLMCRTKRSADKAIVEQDDRSNQVQIADKA